MHWTVINERRAGGVAVLDLEGQMTLSGDEESALIRRIRQIVQDGQKHLLLNLAHVTYVDSMGIGEIVGAYTRVMRHGGSLRLCGVGPRIQELLDTTNIGTVIESFPTEADALRAFHS